MRCTFEHLSGSKKGQLEQVDAEPITIGRNPTSDLRFDPVIDLDVSADHARLEAGDDGRLLVRDLSSRNGTFLNGSRIADTPVPVEPGARIRLGAAGPEIRVAYTPGPKRAGATRLLLAEVQRQMNDVE